MLYQSLSQINQSLKNKEYSSVELTRYFLDRIKKHDSLLNSFISVNEDQALQQAQQADIKLAEGTASCLTGIPIAHKDIFCTKALTTTAGSRTLENFVPPYNATVIEKFNQQNAILLGKTNMDEFAMGSSNETSYFGPTLNPWNTDYVPGGSSGGSAVAVCANLAPAATGSDTGGSIRQPAALCGLTGIKPTYGSISRYGMIAYASSFDQAGPLTRCAADAALMLNVMTSHDSKDSTSTPHKINDFTVDLNRPLKGMTIGLPAEYFDDHIQPEVSEAIHTAIKQLEKAGASFKTVYLANTAYIISCYYILTSAECSSNLSRYDGIRYGYRNDSAKNIKELYQNTRSDGFGDEVKRRILTGAFVLASEQYEAFYQKAQKIRRLIRDDFQQAFQSVDLLLSPTSPTTAFRLGEKNNDPLAMYLSDKFTLAINLAGLPALSMPCGQHNNLPIGAQLIAPHFKENRLLNVAHQYQLETDWHLRTPAAFQNSKD